MKKLYKCRTMIFVVILAIGLIFVYRFVDSHLYFGWKDVSVDGVSFKVPNDWKQEEKNGLVYFYKSGIGDGDYDGSKKDIVFFQSKCFPDIEGEGLYEPSNILESNILSDKFHSIAHINGTTNSLGVIYGESLYIMDNVAYYEKYLNSYCGGELLFYAWEDRVDDYTLEKIADSFMY